MVETGLNNPAVEDVVAEKRQEDNTMSESSQWEKILEVETEEELRRPMWKHQGTIFFRRYVLLFLVVEIQRHSGEL